MGRSLDARQSPRVMRVPATAQGSYSPYAESPAAALARYVRTLASDPKDFDALIGAGKAALRARRRAGRGRFLRPRRRREPAQPVAAGRAWARFPSRTANAQGALPYFKRAQQLGASLATIGCDLGLAYDLLGKQAAAQADYRAALNGPDADEARRRLALSLAISGDKDGALTDACSADGAARRRRRTRSGFRVAR